LKATASDGAAGNTGIALNLDVYDASGGVADDWIMYGDSITQDGLLHDTRSSGRVRTLSELVSAQAPAHFPLIQNGGIGGLTSAQGAAKINQWLALFPGRYVSLAYGTNDANNAAAGSTAIAQPFHDNLSAMVRAVLAAGKVPVVPTIPWGRTTNLQANVPVLNAEIAMLRAEIPQIVAGPDLYTYFEAHRSLISGDNIHPSWDSGYSGLRRQWANFIAGRLGGAGASVLQVSGNQLVDGSATVQLHGVNYAGTEYACIQGWGILDGPTDEAMLDALADWNVNSVRIPLNEDCWLGINGVPAQYAGSNYQRVIRDFVDRLHARGIYAELSLMWGGPGANPATYQPNAPDADHAPAFWSSLAAAYKDVPDVILAPWGETTVNWACFRDGCADQATFGGQLYQTAGMQQAVTVMRAAGYTGPIAIPGIEYANDLSQWLQHKPVDPLNQLVAEAHLYGKNACDTVACLNANYAPVAAQVPLIYGETGETYDDSNCGATTYTTRFLDWADAHNVGYMAWTWNTWGTCGSLISDFDGTPNGNYGIAVRTRLRSRT
jgi:endoglucanase